MRIADKDSTAIDFGNQGEFECGTENFDRKTALIRRWYSVTGKFVIKCGTRFSVFGAVFEKVGSNGKIRERKRRCNSVEG
jgi:hypothetical protein